jgi:hypothetical protein
MFEFRFSVYIYYMMFKHRGGTVFQYTVIKIQWYCWYSDCKEKAPSVKARDPEAAKKLWEVSVKMVGLGNWDPFTAPDNTPPPS